jgi:hypothetical protein
MQDSKNRSTLLLTTLFAACCAVALFAANTRLWHARAATQEPSVPEAATTPIAAAPSPSPQEEAVQDRASDSAAASQNQRSSNGGGNLSMQPEAFRVVRSLGKRLKERGGVESQSTGTIKIGGDTRQVHITRRKTDAGESLEVALTGGGSGRTVFTWEAKQDVKTSDKRGMTDTERQIIERLVYDSPDYFALAQLSGASYYTVARRVRPAEAGDDDAYAGPTWDIVSVRESALSGKDDPQQPRVRLFYINTATNLIDQVITPEGEADTAMEVVAEVAQWEERQGERVPARIIWRRGAEVLMEYQLTNFAHNARR